MITTQPNRRTAFAIAGLILATVLGGCGGQNGEEFLGRWEHTKSPQHFSRVIERNGKEFIIRQTSPNMWNGQPRVTDMPAIYKDGSLEINLGPVTSRLTIDQSNGNLVGDGGAYRKVP